ncbi:CRISPR-associated endonuclease Cas3'' [Acidianus manzaensis]|uniref:CRISPR-associated endonuclease Cas3 n=1 Tax=Acidianus manzaensis TaxID=282676 RepID=A0A1W6JWE0_9CREN|nr:CRISPR-associated endonuclease Cas3'' [Acidianus manzaensis]ARM74577.1 CRISPR-associated endonuclease Cas3'' [Acidianus manzaensis]
MCWAFSGKETFSQHGIETLNVFRRCFQETVPIIAKRLNRDQREIEVYTELAIALHDLGKTSKNYQKGPNYYGHEIYSGYLLYKIYENFENNKNTDNIGIPFVLASINHHEAMAARGFKLMRSISQINQVKQFEFCEECREEIEKITIEIDKRITDVVIETIENNKVISPIKALKWFQNLSFSLNLLSVYPIVLGPLMVSDTVAANKDRGNSYSRIVEEYKKHLPCLV